MFAQKIDNLQAQILELQQQQSKYQSLESEAKNALSLFAKIRQQAAELGELEAVAIAFQEALQIQSSLLATPESEVNPEPQKEFVAEEPTVDDQLFGVAPEEEESVTTDSLERYLNPEDLQEALNGDDPDLALMEIASLLDTSHELDLEERLRYFVEMLPCEMGDRLLAYLPKSIGLTWVEIRDKLEADARESLFPPVLEQPQITIGDPVQVKKDGEKGTVSWLGQDINAEPIASVTVRGGTRGSIPVADLTLVEEVETENEPSNEPSADDAEIKQLARQCLGLRSWSQMRIFADCNPQVVLKMQEIAFTKAELRVMNNLPSLILGYIQRANDRSDLEWLPEPWLSEVEGLLGQAEVQAIA